MYGRNRGRAPRRRQSLVAIPSRGIVESFWFTVHLDIHYLWQQSGCEQAETQLTSRLPTQKQWLMLRSDSNSPSTLHRARDARDQRGLRDRQEQRTERGEEKEGSRHMLSQEWAPLPSAHLSPHPPASTPKPLLPVLEERVGFQELTPPKSTVGLSSFP